MKGFGDLKSADLKMENLFIHAFSAMVLTLGAHKTKLSLNLHLRK